MIAGCLDEFERLLKNMFIKQAYPSIFSFPVKYTSSLVINSKLSAYSSSSFFCFLFLLSPILPLSDSSSSD